MPGTNQSSSGAALDAAAPAISQAQQGRAPETCSWLGLPAAAWGRVASLLLILAAIKVVMLVSLAKYQIEIHWRVTSMPVTWLNYAAFYVFVGLGVLSLLHLGRRSTAIDVRAVRVSNAFVLLLGFLFILLTFHAGDKSYLYPVLNGLLRWQDLVWYLQLDFFFRPPYLAGWMFLYALFYYGLVRSGREHRALYLTAAFAGAYGVVCLGEFSGYRGELLAIDCLGLACLVASTRAARRSDWAWYLAPLTWTIFIWSLFFFELPQLRALNRSFTVQLLLTAILFGATALLARKRGFFDAWLGWLPFFVAAFLLLTNTNYPAARNYNHLLYYGLEAPRYFVGILMVCALMAGCAAIYHRLRPATNFWWMDVLNLLVIVITVIDLRLVQIMGVRLGWDVLSFGDSPKMMFKLAKPYLPSAIFGLAIVSTIYIAGSRWLFRRFGDASTGGTGRPFGKGSACAAASFVLLGCVGILTGIKDKAEMPAVFRLVQTSPLWKWATDRPLSRDEFFREAKALGIQFEAARSVAPKENPSDLNVVLVFMESSYNQHLSLFSGSEDTQPLLSKYKDRMEVFPNFFSNFAGSMHARFATFASLYPVSDFNDFTLHRVNVKSLFEVLHDNGWTCSLFYSSYFDYTGFGDFLKHRGIEQMYDADSMPGTRKTERVSWGLLEEETLGAMQEQIKKYAAQNRRFFLTYVPAAPHYPYDHIPEPFRKFKLKELNNYTPLYYNELLYMDWVISSIIDQLKESGVLEHTLVIITNDHGEMLGANRSPIGHGWALTPELANTPLILMDPRKPGWHVNYTVGSQVDLLPSVLDTLGVPTSTNQLYEGRSLFVPSAGESRLAYLNTFMQYGILSGNSLLIGSREQDEPGDTESKQSLPGDTFSKEGLYWISNQGARTVFTEKPSATPPPALIDRFERFQRSLLRDYSTYQNYVAR